MNIDKSLESLQAQNGFRPGDTVLYTIHIWNSGADTATNVELMDAMPTNTTYVANSATDTTPSGNGTVTIEYDDDQSGSFNGADNENAERIKWTWDTVGPQGNTTEEVYAEFKVTID